MGIKVLLEKGQSSQDTSNPIRARVQCKGGRCGFLSLQQKTDFNLSKLMEAGECGHLRTGWGDRHFQ